MSDDRSSEQRRPVHEPSGEAGTADDDALATGNADVDAAIARLAELETIPTGDHVAVYEDVCGGLQRALDELDGS